MYHCGSTLNLPITLRQEGEVECGWTELLDSMQEICMHMHVDAAILGYSLSLSPYKISCAIVEAHSISQ